MTHYRSNLTDLEFNLFDVLGVQDHLASFSDLNEDTARDILREVERFAREEWAKSFVVADRTPLRLEDGEIHLPSEVLESLAKLREVGWDRLGVPDWVGLTGARWMRIVPREGVQEPQRHSWRSDQVICSGPASPWALASRAARAGKSM